MTAPTQRSAWLRLIGAAALCTPAVLCAQTDAQSAPPAALADTASATLQLPQKPLPPVSAKRRDKATTAYLHGAKQLEQGAFPAAEQDFAQAVAFNPAEPAYLAALAVAREHRVTDLVQQAATARPLHPAQADSLLAQARKLDPDNPRVLQRDAVTPAVPMQHTQAAGPIALRPNNSIHDYHQRGDVRSLAQQVARDYGIAVVFDPQVSMQNIRLDVDGVRYDDAMRIFSAVSGTFSTPIDEHTVILATDTTENRQRYDRMVEETFYLPGIPADQLKGLRQRRAADPRHQAGERGTAGRCACGARARRPRGCGGTHLYGPAAGHKRRRARPEAL